LETNKLGQFFDSLSNEYTSTIERCFPRYHEMLWAVLDYLPTSDPPEHILELGAGTGNLSVLIHQRFPQAAMTVVDLSSESLQICHDRIGSDAKVYCEAQDITKLDYEEGKFDLVLSSIAIHHLTSAQKQELFSKTRKWLSSGGTFCFADQCAGVTDQLYQRHIHNWKQASFAAGTNAQEWQMWMEHQQQYDHHDTLGDQMSWLKTAGFTHVDCIWRCLLWSVIQAS